MSGKPVDAGDGHTCAIRTSGTLWCWGAGTFGQLGYGGLGNRSRPTRVGTNTDWSRVTAGRYHSCALRSGTLRCWGRNESGQLGVGTYVNRATPARVGSSTNWRQASASSGGTHTCGARTTGALWCWGENGFGQLGYPAGGERITPKRVGTGSFWASVSTGYGYTCARRTSGSVWCWGRNDLGQLADGTYSARYEPAPIAQP